MIFEIPNFLSKKECISIVELAKKEISPNNLIKSIPFVISNESNNLIAKIREFIKEKTNLPIKNQEEFLITKYLKDGEYGDHYDSFIIKEKSMFNQDFFDCCMSHGGQRIYTFVFYLNDDFSGGETEFPKLNIKVKPQTGKVAYWKNTDSEGNTNELMLHKGSKVLSNEKWVVVIYVREKEFIEAATKIS